MKTTETNIDEKGTGKAFGASKDLIINWHVGHWEGPKRALVPYSSSKSRLDITLIKPQAIIHSTGRL